MQNDSDQQMSGFIMEESTIINGHVEDIVFHNAENGYSVISLQCESSRVVVVGKIHSVKPGESLEIKGRWIVHKIYGKQFQAEEFQRSMPAENEAMIRYLASGFVKGIGIVTAQRIVEQFGSETWDIIQDSPIRLSEVKGISKAKAILVGEAIRSQKSLTETILFFTRFGMSPEKGAKAYKYLGDDAVKKICENPYLLVSEEYGISFKKADMIAAYENHDNDGYLTSSARIVSGIRYILQKAALSGHTYLPYDIMMESCSRVLGVAGETIDEEIEQMLFEKKLMAVEECLYLTDLYKCEKESADMLKKLMSVEFDFGPRYETAFRETLDQLHINLDETQENACISAVSNGVSVISGGPGTGKTTIVRALISVFDKTGRTYKLAAPTGRAAKRMEQASDRTASTIHRLLEIDFVDEEGTMLFSKNRQNPLETDVVIIDEMSMVDIELMHSLLLAVSPGTRLILIGDVDQLPAVGPGNVLHDIIESGIIPCTILEKIYRQETGNMIPLVARDINEGKVPDLITPDRSFEFKPCHNPRDMVREVIKIISKESAENDDIQVIIPGKKGFAGTMNMNRLLQAEFNPPSEWKKEKEYGSRVFREGDKVMQIKNNYELEYRVGFEDGKGIFNGDIGIVMSIDADGGFMEIVFDGGRRVSYDIRDADQLDTAYAITVHKSQGSEYNTVILVLMGVSPMLQTRNLLYTAVSRAVDKLYIVGQGEILRSMVANENKKKRYSGLVNLLV